MVESSKVGLRASGARERAEVARCRRDGRAGGGGFACAAAFASSGRSVAVVEDVAARPSMGCEKWAAEAGRSSWGSNLFSCWSWRSM